MITPAVVRLREELGFPGMVVLQWAFGGARAATRTRSRTTRSSRSSTRRRTTPTRRAAGSSRCRSGSARRRGSTRASRSWGLIELAHASRAALSIVPAQDVLGLGSEARMNRPGTAAGNWRWRLRRGQLTDELAARLRESTRASGAR